MTYFRTELRKGFGKSLCLCLIVVGGLVGASSLPPGQQNWPAAVVAFGDAGLWMAPVSGAFGALAGSRACRRGTIPLQASTARGPGPAGLVECAALVTWACTGVLVVLIGLYGYTLLSASWSHPDILRTLAGILGQLMLVVVGFAVGRLVTNRLSPPVVAGLIFILFTYALSFSSGGLLLLVLPSNVEIVDFFNRSNSWVAPSQLALFLGISLAGTALWVVFVARQEQRRNVAIFAVAGLLLTSLGTTALAIQDGRATDRMTYLSWRCEPGAVSQVCLHPALTDATATLAPQMQPLGEKLQGTAFQVDRFEQRPRGRGSIPTAAKTIAFGLDNTTEQAIAFAVFEAAVNVWGTRESCLFSVSPGDGEDIRSALQAWLTGDLASFRAVDPKLQFVGDRLREWSDAEIRLWIDRHRDAILDCTVRASDLG